MIGKDFFLLNNGYKIPKCIQPVNKGTWHYDCKKYSDLLNFTCV